jgi:thiamine biosynthesis lipoprotein
MSRAEKLLSHLSTVVVTLSGLVYLWMKYFMETDDPFSVVNHPLQPAMLSIHIVAGPVLVFILGLMINSHIREKLSGKSSYNRRSGWISLIVFPLMVVSGYLLQVVTSSTLNRIALVVHLAASGLFAATYLLHQLIGVRVQTVVKVAGIFAVTLCFLAIGSAQGDWIEVTRQVHLMGAPTTLTTYTMGRRAGLEQLENFIRILEETEQELSTWRSDSTFTRLNEQPVGAPFFVSAELTRLFEDLVYWNRETAGTFDPAIGRLTDVWGIHGAGRRPDRVELDRARYRSGLAHLVVDSEAGQLIKQRDITIDVGGFGKGEGLDRVLTYARTHPSTPFLIDMAGQIAADGVPPYQNGWTVDLAHPIERGLPVLPVELTSGSISTSGGSERDLHADGGRIGHILDPRSGMPVVSNVSVSVWHPRALVADILSTALYVMGPAAGLDWAEDHRIAATFLVPSPDGAVEIRSTAEWTRQFSLPGKS